MTEVSVRVTFSFAFSFSYPKFRGIILPDSAIWFGNVQPLCEAKQYPSESGFFLYTCKGTNKIALHFARKAYSNF